MAATEAITAATAVSSRARLSMMISTLGNLGRIRVRQWHLPLPYPNAGSGWFAGAVKRACEEDEEFPRVTLHDLRHTAASLAVSAGANVKAVQRMLGHASAAMTLDVYADLFDEDMDSVAVALSDARALALAI